MIWVNGYTRVEKIRLKGQWHKWFAWFPVTVGLTNEQRKIKVWLQYVERKGEYNAYYKPWCWCWEYQLTIMD